MPTDVAAPAAEQAPSQERAVDASEAAEISAAREKATDMRSIPLSLIQESEVALRAVHRETEDYQLLVNSIRLRGVLNSILVRQLESADGLTHYGLIDGLQRYTAAGDAGLTHIPACIVEMDDAELLEAQIITNMNRVQTKPAELSKHLLRILTRNPYMTKQQLAGKTCQSLSWVEQRLSINKLTETIQELVDTGKIHLTNAYALSKIPQEEQPKHVDAAMSESPKTFVPRMKGRVKEIRDAKNAGRDASEAVFQPTQHLQKIADVKKEHEALSTGKGESVLKALIEKHKPKTPLEAVKLTIAWMLHFDAGSQAEQKRKDEIRTKKREEKKEELKVEREKKKADDAAAKAADLTVGL